MLLLITLQNPRLSQEPTPKKAQESGQDDSIQRTIHSIAMREDSG